MLHIIEKRDSPEAHCAFLPSAETQRLLEFFKKDIIMDGEDKGKKMQMWHLDSDVSAVSRGTEWAFNALLISCNWYFVPKKQKDSFIEKFNEVKGLLDDFTKPHSVARG
jgi:hypothetical protein